MPRRAGKPKEKAREITGDLMPWATLVAIEGRDFATIGPGDPSWTRAPKFKFLEGSFVRLRPPAGASDEKIADLRDKLVASGCRVTVERRQAESQAVIAVEESMPDLGHRETVLAMIEESNSEQKDELRRVCEETMAAVGL